MNAATFWHACFRNNWLLRHDPDPRWRRIHRMKARQALYELRFLAARPTKRRAPSCAYGQQGM